MALIFLLLAVKTGLFIKRAWSQPPQLSITCEMEIRQAAALINGVVELLQGFEADTPIQPWCADMRARYDKLEDVPDTVKRCLPESDPGYSGMMKIATSTQDQAHEALNRRCY